MHIGAASSLFSIATFTSTHKPHGSMNFNLERKKPKWVIAEMQPENISHILCEFHCYCLRQGIKVRRHRKSWKETRQQRNIIQSKPGPFAFKIIQHTSAAVNFVQILDSDVHDLEEHTQSNFIELHSVTTVVTKTQTALNWLVCTIPDQNITIRLNVCTIIMGNNYDTYLLQSCIVTHNSPNTHFFFLSFN